jgi:ribosomal-protein-alanine N-acetyltransferase
VTLAHATDRIESERLIFRRIEQADFEFFARIHADPIVARYLGNGRARSIQETMALLENFYATYKSLELGPLPVLRKSDGALIGRCGLSDMALEVTTASGTLPRVWYQRSQVPSDTNVISSRSLDTPLTETTGAKAMPVRRRPGCSSTHLPQCRFDASFP